MDFWLKKYRKKIDKIDSKIVKLLAKRGKVAIKIAAIKNNTGWQIYDSLRESNLLKRLYNYNSAIKSPFSNLVIENIYNIILQESRLLQSKKNNGDNNVIILCGPKAVGKTTIARELAKKYNYVFIDIDELMLNQENNNINDVGDLFEFLGEANFRNLEMQVVESLAKYLKSPGRKNKNYVVALGGSTLLNPSNYYLLKNLGFIVYLRANYQIILERIMAMPTIPRLFQDKINNGITLEDALTEYATSRKSLYETYSNITVDVDNKLISNLADEIEMLVTNYRC